VTDQRGGPRVSIMSALSGPEKMETDSPWALGDRLWIRISSADPQFAVVVGRSSFVFIHTDPSFFSSPSYVVVVVPLSCFSIFALSPPLNWFEAGPTRISVYS
jgi:hypothetical protein